jgi:hypothetical protein
MPNTSHIISGRATLNDMITILPLDDPILLFLNNKIEIPFEFKATIREA